MTQTVYRNKRNGNKYIIVKHTNDRHYMWKQELRYINGIVNAVGSKTNRGRFHRERLEWIKTVLEDYEEATRPDLEAAVREMVFDAMERTTTGLWVLDVCDLERHGITEQDWYYVLDFINGMTEIDHAYPDNEEIVLMFYEEWCPKYEPVEW